MICFALLQRSRGSETTPWPGLPCMVCWTDESADQFADISGFVKAAELGRFSPRFQSQGLTHLRNWSVTSQQPLQPGPSNTAGNGEP